MSDWENFKTGAERFFDRATREALKLGDTAALKLKIKNLEIRLDEEYSKLGRLCYKKLRLDADNTAEIDAALDDAEKTSAILDTLRAELEKLRAMIAPADRTAAFCRGTGRAIRLADQRNAFSFSADDSSNLTVSRASATASASGFSRRSSALMARRRSVTPIPAPCIIISAM